MWNRFTRAITLRLCIIDNTGLVLVHKKIKDDPEALLKLLKPYNGDIVVGVECMDCWYGVAGFCKEYTIDFILAHALYMKAIHGGKAKNDKIDSHKIAKLICGGNFPLDTCFQLVLVKCPLKMEIREYKMN